MKILLISPNPNSTGGIARWTRNVLVGLKNEEISLEINLLSTTRKRFVHPQMFIPKRIFLGVLFNTKILIKYIQILQSQKLDLIHINTSGRFAFIRDLLLVRLARYYNIKVVVHMHFGRLPEIFEASYSIERHLARAVVLNADAIFVLDRKSLRSLLDCVHGASVYLIPNFIDSQILKYDSDNRKLWDVIYAGQLLISKGLVEFLTSIENTNYPLNVCICGKENKGTKKIIEEFIARNSVHKITFYGEVNHNEVIELIRDSRTLILPSYTEGFPNVVIEAMAQKTIVIATSVGAIPDILNFTSDEPLGLEIGIKSYKSIIRQLDLVMNESEKFYEELTNRAFQEVKFRYTAEVVCQELFTYWRDILSH